MLGGREALTGIAMRGTTPMPIRKVVALADDELDDARVPGRALHPPRGRKDAHEEQLDRPARNTCTSQPIVAENLRESLGKRCGPAWAGEATRIDNAARVLAPVAPVDGELPRAADALAAEAGAPHLEVLAERQLPAHQLGSAGEDREERVRAWLRLIDASRYGRVADVAALLADGVDVNARNADGESPALVAARRGHYDVLKLLGFNHDICELAL